MTRQWFAHGRQIFEESTNQYFVEGAELVGNQPVPIQPPVVMSVLLPARPRTIGMLGRDRTLKIPHRDRTVQPGRR